MNTFTKTLIATAMAVAVPGTASADVWGLNGVNFNGVYSGSKTKIQVRPSGCPNGNLKNQTTVVGFTPGTFVEVIEDGPLFAVPYAGCWAMAGLRGIIDPDFEVDDGLTGTYIERKVGRDLTMALTGSSLEDVVDVMNLHLITESKCNVSAAAAAIPVVGQGVDPLSVTVHRGHGNINKNGERIKVNIDVRGTYDSSDKSDRNIRARINGRMDFNPTGLDPLFTCADAIVHDYCPDDVCIDD